MRRTEEQHNTPEQVAKTIAAALKLVRTLEIPPALEVVAFTKAVDLLASKQIFFEQPQALPLGAMHIPGRNH